MFIPIGIPGYVFGFAYLLYSIYGMKAKNDNIGHTAHFGGAIAGYAMTLIQKPSLFIDETFLVGLLAIPIILLFILLKTGKI
jgi:membrane associated rhomboid family serine protease